MSPQNRSPRWRALINVTGFFAVFTALGTNQAMGATAVTVNVNASSAICTLPNELYGQNMSVYDSSAQPSDSNFAGYTAAVSYMGIVNMRFPGGGYGDMY